MKNRPIHEAVPHHHPALHLAPFIGNVLRPLFKLRDIAPVHLERGLMSPCHDEKGYINDVDHYARPRAIHSVGNAPHPQCFRIRDDRFRAGARARQALLREAKGWPVGIWAPDSDRSRRRELGSYLAEVPGVDSSQNSSNRVISLVPSNRRLY